MDLTDQREAAIRDARRAMAMSIEFSLEPGPQVIPMTIVALAGGFADVVSSLGKGSAVVDLVNHEIRRSGYRLVSVKG